MAKLCKIRFTVACLHNSPDEYTALVVLSICWKKTMRSIICCPIFELPDRMRSNSSVLSARSWQTGLDGWVVIVFNILLQEGFLISTQIAKRLENIWSTNRDLALFQKRFGVHSHNIHHPRNAPVLVVAVAPCEFAPGLSRPSPALPSPSKSPMPCSPHYTWMNFLSFLRASKIENQQIPKSKEKSMKSPGSLLGAKHFDRYKTRYPRVSVMTLQSPHHAAKKTSWLVHRILQWQIWNSMNTCWIYRLIIYIIILYYKSESTNCVLHFVQWLTMLPRGHPHQTLLRCPSRHQGNVPCLPHWLNAS